MSLLATALDMAHAGLCVIPARPDGSKAPGTDWKTYQHTQPTEDQLIDWFTSDRYDGLGIITGATSGNLEMLEVEGRATHLIQQIAQHCHDHGLTHLWDRIRKGYVVRTPTGGVHWHYRIADGTVPGNTKLARRPSTADELAAHPKAKVQVLIETRGEGGFTVTAPSNGRTHPTGKPWVLIDGSPTTIPTITTDERDALHAICRLLDQMPEPEAPDPTRRPPSQVARDRQDGRIRPGDDYNQRATWDQILTPHGWSCVTRNGRAATWRRPGKNIGISATTGRNDGDNLYVFSTSTEFDAEHPYSKFAAFTLLDHGGDYQAAAKTLQAQGYGTQPEPRQPATATQTEPPPPPDEPPDDQLDDTLWDAHPLLTHCLQFARARMVSPWAVLGVQLVRIAAAIPPSVVLPAIVGSHASLNTFIGLVGRSGDGKDTAISAARDGLEITYDNHVPTVGVGSGEGLLDQYAHWVPPDKGDENSEGYVKMHTNSVIFTASEVDTLGALASRQSSTLLPELRKAWSGDQLGFAYRTREKRLILQPHTYRLGLLAGVQPERAHALLNDADGGTPQRFLWMPVTDPTAPDDEPDEPAPLVWIPPEPNLVKTGVWMRHVIDVCDTAVNTIRQARRDRLKRRGEPLDGHVLLAQLKVAAILGVIDNRYTVNDDDWRLAGRIIDASNTVRLQVQATLSEAKKRENRAKGEAEADRAVLVDERKEEASVRRVARRLRNQLPPSGTWVMRGDLRGGLAGRDRTYFDQAVARLIDAGQAEKQDVEYRGQKGEQFRRTERVNDHD